MFVEDRLELRVDNVADGSGGSGEGTGCGLFRGNKPIQSLLDVATALLDLEFLNFEDLASDRPADRGGIDDVDRGDNLAQGQVYGSLDTELRAKMKNLAGSRTDELPDIEQAHTTILEGIETLSDAMRNIAGAVDGYAQVLKSAHENAEWQQSPSRAKSVSSAQPVPRHRESTRAGA
ncbi:hypothetical protein [Nocardia farcinica]|uniref:hypothetical protein n=1 Tax=Nocardia farcinica TaxID=37329 RepID=UPI0024584592|nr:hypothetical protein [Nocardia farcinica]